MKNIYAMVLAFLVSSALLFAGSFFYLDSVNHKTFYYTVRTGGYDTGAIRIDRFVTESKIVYKSVKYTPFDPCYTEHRQRIVLDKNYSLEDYTKERVEGKNSDIIYIENFKNLISFVSRYGSKFSYSENIPVKKETFVFEEESPVTYIPIIENYNFSRGRSQGFNAISCIQSWSLPPMKRFITLTSIRDERIKIGSRKIDSENLILKVKDYPQGSLWVAKSDRSLLRLEIPGLGLTVTRTFKPKPLKTNVTQLKTEGYTAKDVTIKSGSGDISGTITLPDTAGKSPAILLSPGSGPADRDYQGLFSSIADHMSRSGFVTLRFDKTGVGSSTGDYSASTKSRELEDLESALIFLAKQDKVDNGAIAILGHASGAINALKLAEKISGIRAVVMLAPSPYPAQDETAKRDDLRRSAQRYKWTDDYLDLVYNTIKQTHDKAASQESDWAYMLGKKCFLREIRDEYMPDPINFLSLSDIPVLILQPKDSDESSPDPAESLDRRLAQSGNTRHSLTYYAYLGPYFGAIASDGTCRNRYACDIEALEKIRTWLDSALKT